MPGVLLWVDYWVPAEGVMGRSRQLRRWGLRTELYQWWEAPGYFRGNSNSYLLAQIEKFLFDNFFFKGTCSVRFTTCLLMKHVDLSPSEKTYRERKKCVEKISKDFILQQNYEICRTDYLCMGRKNKHTHEPELYSGWENEATEWDISHRQISASSNSISCHLQDSPLQYHSAWTPPAVGSSLPPRAAIPFMKRGTG